jgi:DNA replication protein DnaC
MTAMFKLENSTAICQTHQVNMVVIVGNTICPQCATEDVHNSKINEANAQSEQWISTRTKQAFFPRRHTECTLKSYVVKSHGQQVALEACVTFSKDLEAGLNKNLMLVGSTGTGKTHLVCGIGRYLLRSKKSVRYITSAEIAEKIMGSWSCKDQTEQSVIDELASYDLLIVDEVGLHDSSTSVDGKAKSMNDMKREAVHKLL